jgi:[ribosomal protein S5]-alanine N-acetyltransferase
MRRLVASDLDDLYALYRDPVIRRYFPEGTLTLEETREELEWFLNGHPDHPELGLWPPSTSRPVSLSAAAACCRGPSTA